MQKKIAWTFTIFIFLLTLDLYYIIYLNMVENKCFKMTWECLTFVKADTWLKTFTDSRQQRALQAVYAHPLHGELPPRLMLVLVLWIHSYIHLALNGMAEEADSSVSSRAERKALQKAKILQRENERKIFRLVRRANTAFAACFSS